MARVKLRCIMGYPGLKSSDREKSQFKYIILPYCFYFVLNADLI